MKLRFKKKKKGLPKIDKPDIFEPSHSSQQRKWAFFIGIPAIMLVGYLMESHFILLPMPVSLGVILGILSYFTAAYLVKEEDKNFWKVFVGIFGANLGFFYGIPLVLQQIPGVGTYNLLLLIETSFVALPFIYIGYLIYIQWKERTRNPLKRCMEDVKEEKLLVPEKKQYALIAKLRAYKKSLSQNDKHLEDFQADLLLLGLSILIVAMLIIGFLIDPDVVPAYVCACTLTLGSFIVVVGNPQRGALIFWLVVFCSVVIGVPFFIYFMF